MKTFKKLVSLLLVTIMLTSSVMSTGVFASANTEIADEIMEQAQAEPSEDPINDSSVWQNTKTPDKNSSVVVPENVKETYSGTCGDNLIWTLDISACVLYIDGTGDMYDYGYRTTSPFNTAPWKNYISSITSVVIGESVTSIGTFAFYCCTSIASVTIPNSVTSIGNYAFDNCPAIIKCYENSYTHTYAVNNGFAYELLVVFSGKCGVELIWTLNTSTGILSISGKGDMRDYSSGGPWYSYRSYVKTLIISDSVTSIGDYAFSDCYALTSVNIPNSVKSIGSGAFKDCTSLTSITIPDSVTSINSYTFDYCISLVIITIPESVTIIDDRAFADCLSLKSVTIGNSVTNIGDFTFAYCASLTSVTIGNSVTSIGSSAFFLCTSLTSVNIPDSVTSIGDYAFADCYYIISMTIPNSVTSIGNFAFAYCDSLTIACYENSYAHTYAVDNGFKYELICDHIFTNYISDNNAICTEDGTLTAYCDNGCGATDTIIDEGTALGHTWTEWITTVEPTYTTEGERIRYCTVCKFTEGEKLPALELPVDPDMPVITVDNFTVIITNSDNIKDMRYAPGVYSTTTEIRNAEGNVALDNGVVTAHTVDGNFVYEMPNGGMYTIWIRMKDGTNYILPLDVTKVIPKVTTYGVKITVDGLYNVKDCFIAKGEFNTYNEIKDNGYIVRLTANKIAGKHSYTYTVSEPGMHTVLVRYNDGSEYIFHEELTVDEPVFTTNGLQVTISNIPDVKVIRTAYGEYYTPGDTKRAEGARNFSNKSVIKNADEYMIQYRDEGIVTIIVEYNNGYVKVFHYDVEMKRANCMQAMSSVIFDNLDGFVMIRYAMGEYATSAEIKRAPGSKVIKPADITDGRAVISGLAKGTYTFCVQFDDDSYNYFTVTVE